MSPSLSQDPSLKIETSQATLFENLVGGSIASKGEEGAHYD